MASLSAFLIGLLFGTGLVVSRMVDPAKVLGFLDFAGAWDPSLALVMVSALATTFVGYRIAFSRGRPLLGERFHLPSRRDLDMPLVLGAGVFGAGWGLSGFCPGPGVTALGLGDVQPYAFVAAMVAGMLLRRLLPETPAPAGGTGR